ncbi:MAG TPA: hypothetical protein VKK31_09250 [Thermoanaerobaculia bacterium]|nr:hypothetical protein [Thermoanaerobaculia bacterium]
MKALARVRGSLAYRSMLLYRPVLEWLPPPSLEKPRMPLTFLTFGGDAHRPMIRECLASLQLAWPQLPRVRVVTDGVLDPAVVRRDLSWWRGSLECVSWRDVAERLAEPRFATLVRFAERDAMGRKMAAVVASALDGPTLYSDVDILWFRFPPTLERLLVSPGTKLAMSPDYQPTYDRDLVPGRLPHLANPPYFCAGLLYAEGDLLAACDVSALLEHAAERGIGVTEQTILAEMDHRLGARIWPAEEIALWEEDRVSLGPSFRGRPWAARHYVGAVRHIFWRDALALRAGLKP